MVSIGIVTALEFEVRALGKTKHFAVRRCIVAGADADSAVRELADSGIRLIVSWGTAGSLSPDSKAGDIYLPEQVITRNGVQITTDPDWRSRFLKTIGDSYSIRSGVLADSPHLLAGPQSKRQLRASTGAELVDMESGAVGKACERLGVPFLVIRVIIDELEDRLSPYITTQVDADRKLRPATVLAAYTLRPWHWGALIRLVRRYQRAKRSLVVAAAALRQCAGDD